MVEILKKDSVLAKPDTLQVYSFNGAGGVSNQLPMKPKKTLQELVAILSYFLKKNNNGPNSKVVDPINHN